MEQVRIPVAVAPREAAWAVDAIRRGGGEPVALGQEPVGLVWTDTGAAGELRDVLLLADRIAENIQRLMTGQELAGRVDPDLGY
jgi:hypothetical protein